MLDIMEPGTDTNRLVVGIDLGTTHSLVACMTPQGQWHVLPDAMGKTTLPSVVSYRADGLVNVGAALPEAVANIYSVKRLMGLGRTQAEALPQHPSWLLTGTDTAAALQVGTAVVTPVEASAAILRTLKRRAEEALEQEIFEAVITIPAYFDEAQRQATKDAAKLAGLNVLRLLPEPTAAALAYGLDTKAQGTFLVYDLGGGTFDVSILKLMEGVFQVLATAGDTHLGGDDIDALIAAHLSCSTAQAKVLKEQLTTQNIAQVEGFTLMQDDLNRLVTPLLQKTFYVTDKALADAHLTPSALSGVILVGGQTRMPLLREGLAQHLGQSPLTNLNPDEVVAVGAALQADNLTRGKCAEFLLLDVNPLSLGLETMGGLVEKIIPRNTPIPITKAAEFTTYQDGQTAIKIHVLQGERDLVTDCRSLATFTLGGIPPMKAGQARVQVVFALDGDGLLTVYAKDLITGATQQVEVTPTTGISEQQMVNMMKDSLIHAAHDIQARRRAEAGVDLERSILAATHALDEAKAQVTPTDIHTMRDALQKAKDSFYSLDPDHLRQQQQQLEAAFTPLVAQRMAQLINKKVVGRRLEDVQDDL